MQIRFRVDSWQALTRARASTTELSVLEPYFARATMTGDGTGRRCVVECPDALARLLEDFLRRHEQTLDASVKLARDRGHHDTILEADYSGTIQAHQDVTGALGIAGRL